MMCALIYIAFALAVIALAEQCSRWDAEEIACRIAHGGGSLEHGPLWISRAALVGVAAFAAWLLADSYSAQHWSTLVPLLCFGAFAFSAWFRYRLNRKRAMDYRYISRSNCYDRVFIYITPFFLDGDGDVYSAGAMAYRVELINVAACIVWVALAL